MEDKTNYIRNSAKAIIIKNNCLLAVKNYDPTGDWYLLPGGGQNFGENLFETLRRECLEEIGANIKIGRLCLIREYIAKNHEFAAQDGDMHQVEFMFECEIEGEYSPLSGSAPDSYQTDVVWIPIENIQQYRIFPSVLKEIIKDLNNIKIPVYLGDVN